MSGTPNSRGGAPVHARGHTRGAVMMAHAHIMHGIRACHHGTLLQDLYNLVFLFKGTSTCICLRLLGYYVCA